jgi:inner membrane protein
MDSLTHVVLGAVTGDLLAGKKLGKKAMLWGALINSLPDIDVGCMAYMTVPEGLIAHRGFTHSFAFAFLLALLLAFIIGRLKPDSALNFRQWSIFFFIELALHCIVDVFTAYGTALAEPFSHERYALHLLFVADPIFTFPWLIAFFALLILNPFSSKRIHWSRMALIVTGIYLVFVSYSKVQATRVLHSNLVDIKNTSEDHYTTPTPFNSVLWYITIRQDSGMLTAHYSLLDSDEKLVFYYTPKNDSLAASLPDRQSLETLIRFSEGYYCLRMIHDTLAFHDVRFGQIGGWYRPDAPYVFRYNLSPEANNAHVMNSGRSESSTREALRELKQRIFRDHPKGVLRHADD